MATHCKLAICSVILLLLGLLAARSTDSRPTVVVVDFGKVLGVEAGGVPPLTGHFVPSGAFSA